MSIRYISVYQRIKAEKCNVCSCHWDGHCESCNYGGIREQAAKDHNLIMAVRKFIAGKCPRFKNSRLCYYDDTACEYKDFCQNVKPGSGLAHGTD